MSQKRNIAIGLALVAAILGAASLLPVFVQPSEECFVGGVCQHEQQIRLLTSLTPTLVALAVLAGAAVYYFMAGRLDTAESSAKGNAMLVLKMLNADERKVVERIIKDKGKCLQSDISRIEGLGKLKSHRILQRLADRGITEIEHHGKTNIVRFKPELEKWLVGDRG